MKPATRLITTAMLGMLAVPGAEAALLYSIEAATSNNLTTVNTRTGEVREVGPLVTPIGFGGLSFAQDGSLYFLGADLSGGFLNDFKLFTVNRQSGALAAVGQVFDSPPQNSMDGFAIIGGTGYTIRHENNNELARLYAIDLSTAAPTSIGAGYAISGFTRDKVLGLTTDGANLFGIQEGNSLSDGRRLVRFDLATGQIDDVVGAEFPVGGTANLAFAEGKFWTSSFSSVNSDLYVIDPLDATPLPTLVHEDMDLQYADSLTAAAIDLSIGVDLNAMELTGTGDINGVNAAVSITQTAGATGSGTLSGVYTEGDAVGPTKLFLEGTISVPFDLTLRDLDGVKPDLVLQGVTEAQVSGREYDLVPLAGMDSVFAFSLSGEQLALFDDFLFDSGGAGFPGTWGSTLLIESLLASILDGTMTVNLLTGTGSMTIADMQGVLTGVINPPFMIPMEGLLTAQSFATGVPAPATLALLTAALGMIGFRRRRVLATADGP